MLVVCITLLALCTQPAAVVGDGCGPNVVPLSIFEGKPCQLRLTRSDLNVSNSELWDAVRHGLQRGSRLAERLKKHEQWVSHRLPVPPATPEYKHYNFFTKESTDSDKQHVLDSLDDLANVTALANFLVHKFNISKDQVGDLLIDMQVPADPSHFPQSLSCNASAIYRAYNGSCNNLKHPIWGMSETAYPRLVSSVFHDGINVPRKSVTGKELPNARILRQNLLPTGDFNDDSNTLLLTQFGQLIAHDSALSNDWLGFNGLGIECCSYNGSPLPCKNISIGCYPAKIPKDDTYYADKGVTCMSVARSRKTYTFGGILGPAETINSENHFIDASFTYGPNQERAYNLRKFEGGKLSEQVLPDGRKVLPQVPNSMVSCSLPSNRTCFIAGDARVNQNTQLTILQNLYLREHNRVANKLSSMNPHWDDEKTYQEARRIVIAEHQHITYTEFVSQLVVTELLDKFPIESNQTGYSNCYKEDLRPATLAEFTEAVFRMFHGTAQGDLLMYKDIGCPVGKIKINKWFNKPEIILKGNNFDQLTLGLSQQASTRYDSYTVYELNRNMFQADWPYGQDLDMFDIIRGRDGGLGRYNDYRELIGLPRATKFEDFTDIMSYEDAMTLKQYYEDPDDVDLMMVMLENVSSDILTVRQIIVAEQFYRWKCGDRFFYDYVGSPYPFSEDQINEIKKVTMSRIICDNSDNITRIQTNSFKKVNDTNPAIDCTLIPEVDLSYWKEEQ
ncbi:peroxidase-like isoform X1 [Schistocerca gregaria]|uniref:peroxidase-like isoform X1 n=1 Tax=Schistocerca gregaria TaxID=7010 RepID=UPI00211E0062|nr:peroxidase-like isoform X1 [Schistocerca gregaria]